jgi:hypothetical protein
MQGHGGDVSYHRMDEWTVFECHIPNAIAVIHRAPEPNLDEPKTSPKSPKYVKVAVCIEPEAENLRLIEMLLAENFEGIKFTEVRGEADLVISNSEDIMIEVLESDSQEYFSVASFKDTSRMFEILKRKLGSNPS